MDCTDETTIQNYQNQLQLISLWIFGQQHAVHEFEIFAAGARIGVDIQSIYFKLPKASDVEINHENTFDDTIRFDGIQMRPHDAWKEFLCATQLASAGSVSAHDVVFRVLKLSQIFVTYKKYVFKIIVSVTVILVWLPLMMDMSDYTDPWKVVFVLSSNYILAVMFVVDIHFLVAAIMDASRRYHVAQILSRMARPSHLDVAPVLNFKVGNFGDSFKSLGRSMSSVSTRSNSIMSSVSISSGSRSGNHASPVNSKVPPTPAMSNHSSPRDGNSVGSGNGSVTSVAVVPLDEVDIEQQPDTFMNASIETTKDNKSNVVIGSFVEPHRTVSSSDVQEETFADVVPRVDFRIHQNLYAWLYTRTVLLDYGHRMQVRVNVYVGEYISDIIHMNIYSSI